jgi:SAM-dependent methyltransferase
VASRALQFGSVAAAYERFRFAYPEALFHTVMGYAGGPLRTALEIGAGTGKATRLFARHGILVTATDPDSAMLAELRKHVPATVKTVQSAFEDLQLSETYQFVYAAASLHWTRPEGRWSRIAALLEPGGVFACFGAPLYLADPDVDEKVRAARAPFLDSDDVPSPELTAGASGMQWPGADLERSEEFTDVRESAIERRFTLDARDYVGHLSTVSAYLELPTAQREQVYDRILRVLPAEVEVVADLTIHLARRECTRGK